MQRFTLKSGTNKGNRRIWIEGKRLADAGLTKGTQLFRTMNRDGSMVITTTQNAASDYAACGKHRVAGSDSRPIVDLCGKWVSQFVGDHTHVRISISDHHGDCVRIFIRPCDE